MARPSKLTDELVERIHARRQSGCTYEQLSAEFELSRGTIGKALAQKPKRTRKRRRRVAAPAKKKRRKKATARAKKRPTRRPRRKRKATADEPGLLDVLPLLERQIEALEDLADEAHREENIPAFRQLSGTLNNTISLLEKLRPPPPPDHDQSPDMIKAAQRAQDKLRTLVQRARDSAALEAEGAA